MRKLPSTLEVTTTTEPRKEISRVETLIGTLGAVLVVLLAVAELLLPAGQRSHRPALGGQLSPSQRPK